jgi:low temperature requirement protein LtrA
VARRKPKPQEAERVSTLELFFDLVFVFTLTQLTTVLVNEPTRKGLVQVVLMLGLIYWMYGGYAWLTNAVVPDRLTRRLVLLGGMGGFLVMALAIPDAFGAAGVGGGTGLTFGIAYVVVVAIHLSMFARSSRMSVVQAIRALAPFNISTALMVLVGGGLGGHAQYILWAAAFVIEWISPKLVSGQGFVIQPKHFVERHSLVVIVAIGESVVAVGIGVAGLEVDRGLVFSALLGLALSACLWWSYFGYEDDRKAEKSMSKAGVTKRPQMAIDGYGYAHELILLGVIAIAAGLKFATGHASASLGKPQALMLGAGAAVFLLGEAIFRWRLKIGDAWARVLVAGLCLLTIPLGIELSAAAQLAALVALFVAMIVAEGRTRT